jgi:hypothetical protein
VHRVEKKFALVRGQTPLLDHEPDAPPKLMHSLRPLLFGNDDPETGVSK